MATKKDSTPVLEEEKQETGLEAIQKQLEELKKENAELKKNQVGSHSPLGGMSDYERVQAVCKENAENGGDPWAEKISIRAPRKSMKDDNFYWLQVNGRSLQVPANDKYFEMALPFAECLVNMIEADNRASDYIDGIEAYDPVSNPKKD